jgi:hypothetical protein
VKFFFGNSWGNIVGIIIVVTMFIEPGTLHRNYNFSTTAMELAKSGKSC